MAKKVRTYRQVLSLALVLVVSAAACGGGGDALGDSEAAGDEIVISGSSTVEPISVAVAESFRDINPNVQVAVSGPGTGDGFKLFCEGETDISDASRQIKDEEKVNCEANGISYVELKVGVDGIAVITSSENQALSCLSFADLYALVGPESTGFGSWAEAQGLATELGSSFAFEDSDLVISAPGTESGTYDSFIEIVLEDLADERGHEATTRPDYSSAADDNVIIETVAINPTSFGWVGFAFADHAEGTKLVDISVDPDGDCVAATAETIASNEYPISRDLFIYVNTDNAASKAGLVEFVDHYMGFGLDEAVANVGYVILDDGNREATRSAWSNR